MITQRSLSRKTLLQMGALLTTSGVLGLNSINAQAAGFEKSVLWSAHWSALGGAATSSVSGPEALYFNPAGLASSEGLQFSVSGTATLDKITGPATGPNTSVDSKTRFFSPVGILISKSIQPKWGVGLGFYSAGGTRTEFENLSIPPFTLTPTYKADLTLNEIAVGTGYEVIEGLKVGAAYRVLLASADLQYGGPAGANLVQYNLNGLSGTRYTGLKLGVQYAPKDAHYGLGAEWRNSVEFTLKSDTSSAFANTATLLPGTAASVTNTLPQHFSVGGFYDVTPNKWRVLAEYTFTKYQDNQTLVVTGSATGIGAYRSVDQKWSNMSNVRIGTEYKGFEDWALRAGYVWTSQVTPKSDPSILFSAPGTGNTVVVGAGKPIMNGFTLDGALEYSWAKGSVSTADLSPANITRAGTYTTKAYALHLSLNYSM